MGRGAVWLGQNMNHTGEDTLKAADVYVKAIAVMMQSPETKI